MKRILVRGVVQRGRTLGRTLGFPTANLVVPQEVEVADGVYRSEVCIDGVRYRGMSNVGCNPSVGGNERRIETHLIDFSGDLYGREIEVVLLEKIREECRFADLEELRTQLERDKQQILDTINNKDS